MATVREWIRDFKRLTKWNKFSISLAIFSFIIGISSGYFVFEVNLFSPQNMTGNFVGIAFSEVSQTFESKHINNDLYQELTTTIVLTNKGDRGKFNYKNILIVLPTNQKAFISNYYLYNTIEVAYCTPEGGYCNINPNYILNNTQLIEYGFIDYSSRYTALNSPNAIQKLKELHLCMVLFVKNNAEEFDYVWTLNEKEDCYL